MVMTWGGMGVERAVKKERVESCGDGREGERVVEKEIELWRMRESSR